MDALEAISLIILVLAVLVLVYYYIQNNSETLSRFKANIPVMGQSEAEMRPGGGFVNDSEEEFEESSMGSKFKEKIKDIDKSSFNTDAFSKRIDAFLDEKSEELIQEWSLVTTNDLDNLEERWDKTCSNLNSLEERFDDFSNYTNEKLDNFDARIKSLEDNDE